MGSHLEEGIIKKIIAHQFMDFNRLLPRDHLQIEDEGLQRMELINKNGMTYWSPLSQREGHANAITSFVKWETAFIHLNIPSRQLNYYSTPMSYILHPKLIIGKMCICTIGNSDTI